MQIYLIRHAQAVPPNADSTRPLSKDGIEQARCVASFLKRDAALNPREIWHSTKLRSKQTAEILVRETGLKVNLKEVSGLEPDADPEETCRSLSELNYSVVVVGHLPHLGGLASLLVFGKNQLDAFHFDEASVLCLSQNSGCGGNSAVTGGKCWEAQWMVNPSLTLVNFR